MYLKCLYIVYVGNICCSIYIYICLNAFIKDAYMYIYKSTLIYMCVHICIYIDIICSTIKASFNIQQIMHRTYSNKYMYSSKL